MRLSQSTDHALQALMYMGEHREGLSTITEIAEAYQISRNHLMKVVYRLGVAGFVHSVRGKNGGLRLGRPAAEINVGDVVRKMEENWDLASCFRMHGICPIEPRCKLRGVLGESLDAFLANLDRYTLEDLLIDGSGRLSVVASFKRK